MNTPSLDDFFTFDRDCIPMLYDEEDEESSTSISRKYVPRKRLRVPARMMQKYPQFKESPPSANFYEKLMDPSFHQFPEALCLLKGCLEESTDVRCLYDSFKDDPDELLKLFFLTSDCRQLLDDNLDDLDYYVVKAIISRLAEEYVDKLERNEIIVHIDPLPLKFDFGKMSISLDDALALLLSIVQDISRDLENAFHSFERNEDALFVLFFVTKRYHPSVKTLLQKSNTTNSTIVPVISSMINDFFKELYTR